MLVARLGLDGSETVLDLGAGNGRLTVALIERFEHVIAVEPHGRMRTALEAAAPGATVLAGTAEAIPLPPESVDAVFVGSAFHWFDAARALPEIAKVLQPRGALGMVWGRWARDSSDWEIEVDRVLRRHGTNPSVGWEQGFATTDLFAPLEGAFVEAGQEQDRDGVLARVASISFIAGLPEPERSAVLDEVARIFDSHHVGNQGRVSMPHRIELSWTRKR